MPETVIPLAGKDVTLTIKDAKSPTVQSYTVALTEGTMTLIDGEYEHMIAIGMDGVPITGTAPRQAGVRRRCGATISAKLFDAGDNSADITLLDIIRNDGTWGSNFTSTTSTVETTVGTVNVDILVANRGAVKGATYRIPNARIAGNLQVDITRDGGWLVSGLEFESMTDVKFTATRTT